MAHVITADGLTQIKKRIKELEQKIIPKIKERFKRAKAEGDLRENNPYHDAKQELGEALAELAYLKDIVRQAKVAKSTANGTIQIGNIVKVKINEQAKEIQITSPVEANPLENKISYESPIGKAILNKKPGYKTTLKLEGGTQIKIEVIDILK